MVPCSCSVSRTWRTTSPPVAPSQAGALRVPVVVTSSDVNCGTRTSCVRPATVYAFRRPAQPAFTVTVLAPVFTDATSTNSWMPAWFSAVTFPYVAVSVTSMPAPCIWMMKSRSPAASGPKVGLSSAATLATLSVVPPTATSAVSAAYWLMLVTSDVMLPVPSVPSSGAAFALALASRGGRLCCEHPTHNVQRLEMMAGTRRCMNPPQMARYGGDCVSASCELQCGLARPVGYSGGYSGPLSMSRVLPTYAATSSRAPCPSRTVESGASDAPSTTST